MPRDRTFPFPRWNDENYEILIKTGSPRDSFRRFVSRIGFPGIGFA